MITRTNAGTQLVQQGIGIRHGHRFPTHRSNDFACIPGQFRACQKHHCVGMHQ